VAEFVPLAQWLRGAETLATSGSAGEIDERTGERGPYGDPVGASSEERRPPGIELGIGILRVAAGEAFENAARILLERLARDVLGRELALAPCDLAAIVAAARAELEANEPLCVVVAPGEADVPLGLPRRTDTSLAPGDVVLEARDGTCDARLRVRLQSALEGLGE
jgi:hypothetical protein